MGHPHQPGWHPSIRRETTSSGRKVVLSVTANRRRNESAVYVGRHIGSGHRLTIVKRDGGWWVTALDVDSKYADPQGRVVLAGNLRRLQDAAEYAA